MPAHRILFALSLSVSLHLVAFGISDLLCRTQVRKPPSPAAMLDATLRLPLPDPIVEPVLKDTLTRVDAPKPVKEVHDQPAGGRRIAEVAARRKLARHVFYPEAAVAAGIEGEVRLVLTLDEKGRVRDVQVAGSSGHAILDEAAIRAAYAMGSLPGLDRREVILPVTFQLQP